MSKPRVLVLGAGFGGLELCSILAETLGERVEVTLIERAEAFVFGFSKLDVMFGRVSPESVRIPYAGLAKPGLRVLRETVTAIDPAARRVTTNAGTHEADFLVVALGAEYDPAHTPGLVEGGNEFYSVAGAERLRGVIASFTKGDVIVGVTSAPFKCPPAPSEAALLMHDFLVTRGVRDACTISLVMPFGLPIPPSPDTSKALLEAFAERGIRFVPDRLVRSLDPARRVAVLGDGGEMPYDLFLGIPRHRVPQVVTDSGMTENGWIPVDNATLATRYPGVYAVGDVTSQGTPKAGVFAEGAARAAAASIIADITSGSRPSPYDGAGACYIEFGGGRVGRVDVNFLSGPKPTGKYTTASTELVADKQLFGSRRRARWFGR